MYKGHHKDNGFQEEPSLNAAKTPASGGSAKDGDRYVTLVKPVRLLSLRLHHCYII